MAAVVFVERIRVASRRASRPSWLVVALAACSPGFETDLPPHRVVRGFDSAWDVDITRTGASYVEQACDPRPVQDGPPCAMATTPRANEPVDCPATFVFQKIDGCCLPYHAVSSPTVTDRVYFFECPP
jgi:hypothetical protein